VKIVSALLAVTFLPIAALAENTTRPTSFVGVPWGATPEDAVRILSARTGVATPEELPAGNSVELPGGKFAGQTAATWTLVFADRKLYAASVQLKPDKTAQSLYRELKQMLIAKYGPVAGERKPDTGSEADRTLRRQRRRDYPDMKTYGTVAFWKFAPTLNDKERKTIELELAGADGGETASEAELILTVRYVNETLKPSATAAAAAAAPYRNEPSRPAVKVDDL
jgi:hypothetical protein